METAKDAVAGGVGGACFVLLGHPADTVKVWLQTSERKGIGYGWVKSSPSFKLRTLFAGVHLPLCANIPATAIEFATFGAFRKATWWPESTPVFVRDLVAGSLVGCLSAVCIAPFERVKVATQALALTENTSQRVFVSIVHKEGIQGLFRGITPTLLRDIPGFAVLFMTYEALKSLFQASSLTQVVVCGAVAGAADCIVGFPADVVKSRMQAGEGGSMTIVARNLLAERGVMGLFNGLGSALVRNVPGCIFLFAGFEGTRSAIERYEQ